MKVIGMQSVQKKTLIRNRYEEGKKEGRMEERLEFACKMRDEGID